jgi:hypothetical protein
MAPSFPTQTSDETLKQNSLAVSDVIEDVPCHLSSTKEDIKPKRVSKSHDHHKNLDLCNEVQLTIDGETTRTMNNRGENSTTPIHPTVAKQISTYMDEHDCKYGYIINDHGLTKLFRANSRPLDGVDEIGGNDNNLTGTTLA